MLWFSAFTLKMLLLVQTNINVPHPRSLLLGLTSLNATTVRSIWAARLCFKTYMKSSEPKGKQTVSLEQQCLRDHPVADCKLNTSLSLGRFVCVLAGNLVKTLAVTGVSGHAILPGIITPPITQAQCVAYIIHAPRGVHQKLRPQVLRQRSQSHSPMPSAHPTPAWHGNPWSNSVQLWNQAPSWE